MTTAIGLITFNRPEYLAQSLPAILKLPVDFTVVVDDGSDGEHRAAVWKHMSDAPTYTSTIKRIHHMGNKGVAAAKNSAVQAMLAWDPLPDWIFLAEDDIIATSPEAITGYVRACQESGWESLSFHGHGPMNKGLPLSETRVGIADARGELKTSDMTKTITIWPQFVGAWTVFSQRCFEEVGMFDERLHNGLEHVELSMRLALAGLTPMPPGAADATGSEQWLREIEGSYENSTIPKENFQRNKAYWRTAHPDTFKMLWPGEA